MLLYRLNIVIRSWQRKKKYFFVLFITSFLIYTEVLSYYINTLSWFRLKCYNPNKCTRILLVADPQIIGNGESELVKPLAIYDSDRFLEKTYYHAFNFIEPDVVIFLGDLMDEGSIASNHEFYGYIRRLFNIFLDTSSHTSSSHVRHIWLPGDNDIGGEGSQPISAQNVNRFNRAFAQPDLLNIGHITFFKINRLTESIPIYKSRRDFYNTSKIFVALSHIPLMFIPATFVDKVLTKMLPQVLFTAHEHKSMIVSTDGLLRQDRNIVPLSPESNKVYEFTLGATDMYEFLVPTCSYRMGTDKIGYGYSIIENNQLKYTVLWSPSRFAQLHYYVVMIVIVFLIILLKWCICKRKYSRQLLI